MKYLLKEIRKIAKKCIVYTEHALNEMNGESEVISSEEIREVIENGEIIEDYPRDKRGHSCLLFCFTSKGRPLHIVCSPKKEYVGIITAYIPSEDKWNRDFKTRRKLI